LAEFKKCTNPDCEHPFKPATSDFFYEYNYYNKKLGHHKRLKPECKDCSIKRSLRDRHKDIEKTRERDRVQYYKRRDTELPRMRQGYWNNKEDRLTYHKNWRQTEHGKQIMREHSRFKWMHGLHKISESDWEFIKEYFDWSCAYCGLTDIESKIIYNQYLHKDHVYHDGSNEIDNCVPACRHCNTSKHNRDLLEWYSEDKPYYSKERLDKVTKWVTEDFMLIDNIAAIKIT
jgi:5-methylcytosine-specific restriction endonuclease McrA